MKFPDKVKLESKQMNLGLGVGMTKNGHEGWVCCKTGLW